MSNLPTGDEPDEEPVPPAYGTADSVPTSDRDSTAGSSPYGRRPRTARNGLAVAALACAIVGIAVSWLPLVNVVSIVLGVAAVVFALVSFRRFGQHKLALAGMIVGIMSCVIALLVLLIFGWFLTTVTGK